MESNNIQNAKRLKLFFFFLLAKSYFSTLQCKPHITSTYCNLISQNIVSKKFELVFCSTMHMEVDEISTRYTRSRFWVLGSVILLLQSSGAVHDIVNPRLTTVPDVRKKKKNYTKEPYKILLYYYDLQESVTR